MTEHDHIDEHDPADSANAGFDDDRLLAYALGLEDDTGLRAALAADGALRGRLATMQAELAHVEGGIRSAVAPEPPAYDDPADARWKALRPYFEHRQAPVRRGFFFGRRALSYVAALGIVVAVSVAVVDTQFRNSPTTRSASSATQGSNKALDGAGTELSGAPRNVGAPSRAPLPVYGTADFAGHVVGEAAGFHKVAVARAGDVVAGAQRFAIVRVLKGSVKAHAVTLSLADTPPVAAGVLCVLYLDPLAGSGAGSTQFGGSAASAGTSIPTPTESPAAGVLYFLADAPVLVEPLPAGNDIGPLTLP
jgi:hypothetical protein